MIVKKAIWYIKEKSVKVSYSKYSGPKISTQSNLAQQKSYDLIKNGQNYCLGIPGAVYICQILTGAQISIMCNFWATVF